MYKTNLNGKEIEVKEMSDWKTCIDEDFNIGDYFDSEIAWELINCVPPRSFFCGYFQCGEPHSHVDGKATYLTLVQISKEPEVWQFLGYCYGGERENKE
jgi:hypothetical protein